MSMNTVNIKYGGTYNVPLPFKVPSKALVQLEQETKKPKYAGLYYDNNFKPFIDNTGLKCEKLYDDNYLFVLDFDYQDKWNNPIYQDFKYNDTYTRETNNGLHVYYFSPTPCDIIQENSWKIDLRRTTTEGAKKGLHGNIIVYYPRGSNDLPVMEIDCNKVITELYESNNFQVRRYGDKKFYTKNSNGQYILKNSVIKPWHEVVAGYLKNCNRIYPDWNHGYNYSWNWGIQLGGVLKDELEAEAIATALMNRCDYPMGKKKQWIINFVNGYNVSDDLPYCNIGGRRILKRGHVHNLTEKIGGLNSVNMEEFLEAFKDLRLHQFIKLARSVKTWN